MGAARRGTRLPDDVASSPINTPLYRIRRASEQRRNDATIGPSIFARDATSGLQ
jgi:hypothetical protein